MQELYKRVEQLLEEELAKDNEKFPMFHSWYEAYAVIKEEIEECEDDLETIKQCNASTWEFIKRDDAKINGYKAMQKQALLLACDAIRVASMCKKSYNSEVNYK